MLILFLRERLAWIGFFVFIIVMINILFSLDVGLVGISILYINISMLISFMIFLFWRYIVEVGQLKNFLGNVENQFDDVHGKNLVLSPFQIAYFTKIEEVLYGNNTELNQAKVQLQEYSDELLAWVHEVKAPLTAVNLMLDRVEDLTLRRKLEGIGFDVEDLTDTVTTDAKWLAFIIRQILSNAIKYSPANSEVIIFTEVDATGATLLHIKDAGIGIRKEDLPRIFYKSYTGTAGRESAQSTGMGLYLAHNVAQKIGVRITVQSSVGEGSIFTLRFPLQNEYVKLKGR